MPLRKHLTVSVCRTLTLGPAQLAHARGVRETSAARAHSHREVPDTFGTRGERTVLLSYPARQVHPAFTALADSGRVGGSQERLTRPKPPGALS